MARNARIARLLRVVKLLDESKRGLPAAQLAERTGTPLRSLYRDLDAIEQAGFPLLRADGRFRFVEGWRASLERAPDADELIALYTARQLLRPLAKTPLGLALDRLWARFAAGRERQIALLPPDGSARIGGRSAPTIDYAARSHVIATLDRAIRDSLVVSCRYAAVSSGQVTAREIEPAELYYDAGLETLYLLAWCRLRQAVRVFAVQRFAALSATRKTFAPRPEARSAAALRDAFRIYREGRVRRVSLRFRGPAARLMLERTVRPGQKLERLRGGEVRLTFETGGLVEVARWVLGFGADVVVEGPEDLAAGVRGQLGEALGRYAGEEGRAVALAATEVEEDRLTGSDTGARDTRARRMQR